MPAERTKNTRRNGADANQLVWTTPVEPPTGGIAFAANLTPTSYTDIQMPELVDRVDDDYPAPSSPKRSHGHGRKKPENHIPRPPNAFILFRSSFIKSQHVSTEVETNHSTLSKIIGLTWQNLPEAERRVWHDKAKEALDEHKRKFPTYSFRPSSNKNKNGEKRKVREVGPKDLKRCAKIAELLIEGKKGRELDEAIQEFDKHHVPEIITRFEAPITERAFRKRRSSSVPPPESSQPEVSFLQSDASQSRKPRASSSKPSRQTSSSSEAPELAPINVGAFNAFSFSQPAPSAAPDFTSFTFDASSPPASSFPFESLSPVYAPPTDSMSASLSIDTSSAFHYDWPSSPALSSPMTPDLISVPTTPSTPALSRCSSVQYLDELYAPTPSFASSPAPDATSFNMSSFLDGASTFDQSPNLAQLFQCHPDSLPSACPPVAQCLPGYSTGLAMPGVHDPGMDMGSVIPIPAFSNYIASLPPFAMTA